MSERQRRRQLKRRQKAGNTARSGARIAAGAGITAGAVFGSAGHAQAAPQTFEVDRNDDTVVNACTVALNDCTLRGALQNAQDNNNAPDQDQITFAANVTGTITLGGTELPTIDEPLYVNGPGAGTLTVSAFYPDGDPYTPPNPSRIFKLEKPMGPGLAIPVTIEGLTLSHARVSGSGDAGSGAAIFSNNADLTVKNATISGNYADVEGGGIASSGYSNNTALTVDNSTVTYNYTGSRGGGIKASPVTDLTVQDSTITYNSARFGGGIAAESGSGGPATITRSTISYNAAQSGGGIDAGGTPTTITFSTISGNDGGGVSGGVSSYGPHNPITIEDSTISGNDNVSGAGVSTYGADLTIRRSTIAGNDFGGITSYDAIPPAPTPPTLISTIVADNGATSQDRFQDLYIPYGGTAYADFSLIESKAGSTVISGGSNLLGVDPQLGPLASNGGPTKTMKPASASPVVDQGFGSITPTDQRGGAFNRVFDVPAIANAATGTGAGADIGAFELQASEYVAPPAPTPPVTPVTPVTPSTTPSTGFDLDAALKKCKKKKTAKARKKCKKKAKQQAQG